jgi:stage V sporulation protein AC
MLTGTGIYSRLAKYAGAGTLVPITGFANAVSSSAVEAQTEGLITGVGTKIFTIAGPVILYGCTAAFMYGLIHYVISLI